MIRTASRPLIEIDLGERSAVQAAAELVQSGMTVGLGAGPIAGYVLELLSERRLDIRCVPASPSMAVQALRLGFEVTAFTGVHAPAHVDIAIDGADQVARSGWLVKGADGAHARTKVIAAAARRFVVVVGSDKLVDRLAPPVPLELLRFGLAATVARLQTVRIRSAPPSPDGGVIADHLGEFDDPETRCAALSAAPGVVEHGLFPPTMVADLLIGTGTRAQPMAIGDH